MLSVLNLNFFLFLIQIAFISSITCIVIEKGTEWISSWLTLLVILMNLFILKQVNFLGLEVTTCDAYVIGFLSCLNMVREFYGIECAKKMIKLSLIMPICFLVFTALHLQFTPSSSDRSQQSYVNLLTPSFRLIISSLATFLLVQIFDIKFFSFLNAKWKGKFFSLRSTISLLLSQILDTLIFSFLGLYGLVTDIRSVIFIAILAKGAAVFIGLGLSSLILHLKLRKKI